MPTTLPKPEPSTGAGLMQAARYFLGAAILLVAIGLLWAHLSRACARRGPDRAPPGRRSAAMKKGGARASLGMTGKPGWRGPSSL
jgi:hypothetical protein